MDTPDFHVVQFVERQLKGYFIISMENSRETGGLFYERRKEHYRYLMALFHVIVMRWEWKRFFLLVGKFSSRDTWDEFLKSTEIDSGYWMIDEIHPRDSICINVLVDYTKFLMFEFHIFYFFSVYWTPGATRTNVTSQKNSQRCNK
jgi:hypothetical protein